MSASKSFGHLPKVFVQKVNATLFGISANKTFLFLFLKKRFEFCSETEQEEQAPKSRAPDFDYCRQHLTPSDLRQRSSIAAIMAVLDTSHQKWGQWIFFGLVEMFFIKTLIILFQKKIDIPQSITVQRHGRVEM